MDPSRIKEQFAELEDPRVDRTKRHQLGDIIVMAILAVISGCDGWDDIVDFAAVRESWLRRFLELPQVNEKTSKERAYFLSSHPFEKAEHAGQLVRGHWGIENELHWVLDMVFDEDHSRIRQRRAAQNFARLRKLALSLLKNEPTDGKKSVARKRKRADWDHDYLFLVLAAGSNRAPSA